MKKYSMLVLVLVLTATVFTGCRRNRQDNTSAPTVMPTTAVTTTPTQMPTQATRPTTQPTESMEVSEPSETIDNGNGPAESTGNQEESARSGGGMTGGSGGTNSGSASGKSGSSIG